MKEEGKAHPDEVRKYCDRMPPTHLEFFYRDCFDALSIMTTDFDAIATVVEQHEAHGWATQVTAASRGENPLGAVVSTSGPTPCSALRALNFAAFNRVVGLGSGHEVTTTTVDALLDFYRAHQQSRFVIETTPHTSPAVIQWLEERGLVPQPHRIAKNVHFLNDLPPRSAVDIVRLTQADLPTIASINCQAWGLPRMFRSWFGAPLDVSGFQY